MCAYAAIGGRSPDGMRMKGISVLGLIAMLAACGGKTEQQRAAAASQPVPLTRTVHVRGEVSPEGPRTEINAASLLMSPGGPDELPEGPSGFDVADDGRFLIADPLRKRVAVFDANGGYVSEWRVGFAPDSVTIVAGNSAQVREANSGEVHLYDMNGAERPGSTNPPRAETSRLSGPTLAVVDRARGGPLQVQFEKPGFRLVSVQAIPSDSGTDTFVALESTQGGDAVEVSKSVRRYGADSRLIAETSDLPLDYYVRPVNEIRVRRAAVYQLMPTNTEVRINVWDLK